MTLMQLVSILSFSLITSSALDTNESYEPIQWEYGESTLPQPLQGSSYQSYDNSVMYIFAAGSSFNQTWKLDPSINSQWQILEATSSWVGNPNRVTIVDSSIYIFGNDLAFLIFDTITDSFIANSTELPLPIANQAITSDNTRYIYMFGGLPTSDWGQYVVRYDAVNDSYTTLSKTSPEAWYNPCPVYYKKLDYIYIFGAQPGIYDIYYYDINSNEWSQRLNTLPTTWKYSDAIAIYVPQLNLNIDLIYIFEWINAQSIVSYDLGANIIQAEEDRPYNCSGYSAIGFVQHRIQIWGGWNYNYPDSPWSTNCQTQLLLRN